MNALKSLTFTTLPTKDGNPILDRRAKVIARLEEQKLILKDPNYTRINRKWAKKDGERVMVEHQPAGNDASILCRRGTSVLNLVDRLGRVAPGTVGVNN